MYVKWRIEKVELRRVVNGKNSLQNGGCVRNEDSEIPNSSTKSLQPGQHNDRYYKC